MLLLECLKAMVTLAIRQLGELCLDCKSDPCLQALEEQHLDVQSSKVPCII